MRQYGRNIRRRFPQLGDHLKAQALAKVERTQKLIRRFYMVRTLAWVGLLLALVAVKCAVHR